MLMETIWNLNILIISKCLNNNNTQNIPFFFHIALFCHNTLTITSVQHNIFHITSCYRDCYSWTKKERERTSTRKCVVKFWMQFSFVWKTFEQFARQFDVDGSLSEIILTRQSFPRSQILSSEQNQYKTTKQNRKKKEKKIKYKKQSIFDKCTHFHKFTYRVVHGIPTFFPHWYYFSFTNLFFLLISFSR